METRNHRVRRTSPRHALHGRELSPSAGSSALRPHLALSPPKVILGWDRYVKPVKGWGNEGCPGDGRASLCRVQRPESATPVLCMALVEFTVNSLGQ